MSKSDGRRDGGVMAGGKYSINFTGFVVKMVLISMIINLTLVAAKQTVRSKRLVQCYACHYKPNPFNSSLMVGTTDCFLKNDAGRRAFITNSSGLKVCSVATIDGNVFIERGFLGDSIKLNVTAGMKCNKTVVNFLGKSYNKTTCYCTQDLCNGQEFDEKSGRLKNTSTLTGTPSNSPTLTTLTGALKNPYIRTGALRNTSTLTTRAPNNASTLTRAPNNASTLTRPPNNASTLTRAPNNASTLTRPPNNASTLTRAPNNISTLTRALNNTSTLTPAPNNTSTLMTRAPNNTFTLIGGTFAKNLTGSKNTSSTPAPSPVVKSRRNRFNGYGPIYVVSAGASSSKLSSLGLIILVGILIPEC